MRVFKDVISGDEMVSDSYPNNLIFEDACLEVKSRLISKKANEDFGISCKWNISISNMKREWQFLFSLLFDF